MVVLNRLYHLFLCFRSIVLQIDEIRSWEIVCKHELTVEQVSKARPVLRIHKDRGK